MASSIEDIKRLRSQTGAGMNDAKAALDEAGGDFEKAVDVLRVKGQAKAAKKAEREAKAGLVDSYVHMGRVGALVEVNCETEFVARTDDFVKFVHEIAMQVAAANPIYLKPEDVPKAVLAKEQEVSQGNIGNFYREICLISQPAIKQPDKTVEDLLTEAIAKLGENIVISRFRRIELGVADAE